MRKSYMLLVAAVMVASCDRAPAEKPAGPVTENAAQAGAAQVAGTDARRDPCALVADPGAFFGTPVTSGATDSAGTSVCEWKSEDGRICGSVTLFNPGPNVSPDPKVNYAGLVTSLGAFGEVKDVGGIGEEAKMVDGGMLGAQLAFRTASQAALVGSACRAAPQGQVELAQKLAREIAAKL